MSNVKPSYKRVLLKLSGEALAGERKIGLNAEVMAEIAQVVKRIREMGVELGIVVGGGNFWRGRSSGNMDRVTADHIGMLATTMNALALADALDQAGVENRVMSALEMRQIAETFIRKRALRHLEKGRVIIFAGGTGCPYFSTDTAAALRAAEIGAEVVFKATNVDGVYDSDPNENPDARYYSRISFEEMLIKELKVMDGAATVLCRDNNIKIAVFNMDNYENIIRVIRGEELGTVIS
ncbi:MAG: UMP kinase [Clostridiaceae bacterium]|nr:UMP kinase [Clostridiaceae bacterium]